MQHEMEKETSTDWLESHHTNYEHSFTGDMLTGKKAASMDGHHSSSTVCFCSAPVIWLFCICHWQPWPTSRQGCFRLAVQSFLTIFGCHLSEEHWGSIFVKGVKPLPLLRKCFCQNCWLWQLATAGSEWLIYCWHLMDSEGITKMRQDLDVFLPII